jgi:F-type H+-transporting ATPase subunit delta
MKLSNKQLAGILVDLVEKSPSNVSGATDEFISWLSESGQMKRYRDVVKAVDTVWIEKTGIATVSIESAHELSSALAESLEKIASGAEVRTSVDESLIGGAKVRIDERIIDGSIKGHLEQLTKTLTEA